MQACLPPLSHPPIAIMLSYLYDIVEKFPVLVKPRHRKAPPPPMGAWLAQGGQSKFDKRISHKNHLIPDGEDVSSLFFRYDEPRRPRRGFLCGGSVTEIQLSPCPAVPEERP